MTGNTSDDASPGIDFVIHLLHRRIDDLEARPHLRRLERSDRELDAIRAAMARSPQTRTCNCCKARSRRNNRGVASPQSENAALSQNAAPRNDMRRMS